MGKKGQSISINTIIIAAIGLAVLVVLFYIFTGYSGKFSKGVGEATNCDQACRSAGYTLSSTIDESASANSDCGSGKVLLQGYSVIENGIRKKCCCS